MSVHLEIQAHIVNNNIQGSDFNNPRTYLIPKKEKILEDN